MNTASTSSPWKICRVPRAIVAAVGHRQFKERPTADFVKKLLPGGVVTDVKRTLDESALADQEQAFGACNRG